MTSCRQYREWTHRYVDGELEPMQQLSYEAHLLECEACRKEFDEVRQVVDIVRGSRPLYPAPSSLPVELREMMEGSRSRYRRRQRLRLAMMLGCFAATLLLFALMPRWLSQRFTSFAADAHLRYSKGSLPLQVTSNEPLVVSDWLHQQLPFHLSLPNFPAEGNAPKSYSLVGARLLQFDGHAVAYLAYNMADHPISLLVSSSASVLPTGGSTYGSGKLLFHFSSEKGLKLITWKDRGLSYALVSDFQVNGGQSCVVCHGSEQERRKFENLLRLGSH